MLINKITVIAVKLHLRVTDMQYMRLFCGHGAFLSLCICKSQCTNRGIVQQSLTRAELDAPRP